MTIEVIYRIERACAVGVVEAYGDPDMGWYEWRVIEGDRDSIRQVGGTVLADSGKKGSFGMQYGSPSLALQEGLNHDEPPKSVARDALELVATQLENGSINWRRMAARHEIKAEPIPPSELDAVADTMADLQRQILAALEDKRAT